MNTQYMNAKQIFECYGIPRSALGQLVREGRVEVRKIETEVATTNLYSVADLEKIIYGGMSDVE